MCVFTAEVEAGFGEAAEKGLLVWGLMSSDFGLSGLLGFELKWCVGVVFHF
ncbi:MAG: hypothetical protein ACKERG_04110 [Candidatus Hodgkinia cicadicola]